MRLKLYLHILCTLSEERWVYARCDRGIVIALVLSLSLCTRYSLKMDFRNAIFQLGNEARGRTSQRSRRAESNNQKKKIIQFAVKTRSTPRLLAVREFCLASFIIIIATLDSASALQIFFSASLLFVCFFCFSFRISFRFT